MAGERRKWFKVMCVLLALSCLLSLLSARVQAQQSGGDELEYTRERYDALRQEAAALDAEITDLNAAVQGGRAGAAEKQRQRAANEERAALLAEQITLKQREIELSEAAVSQKQADILQTQQAYDDSYALFTQRLVAIYKMNDVGVMSTLLRVNSFSQLLTVGNSLQRITAHDTLLLADIEKNRQRLEARQEELETLLAGLQESHVALQNDLEALQALNETLQRQIDDELAAVAVQEDELAALQRQREAMQAEMDEVFRNLPASTEEFYGEGAFLWPVPGYEGAGYISSYFGPRILRGVPDYHAGIDISRGGQAAIHGASIVAVMDGTVWHTGSSSGGYGNYLILDHGGGIRTLYAHCDTVDVAVGARVTAGTQIATVGNTGDSTGPHLHFELRLNSVEKVDPYPYLMGQKSL